MLFFIYFKRPLDLHNIIINFLISHDLSQSLIVIILIKVWVIRFVF